MLAALAFVAAVSAAPAAPELGTKLDAWLL
jgi:hypothetical protein